MRPGDLPAEWRALAVQQYELGAVGQARTLEFCANRLEESARQWESEALTLDQAAEESGYSYSALQQMVAGERLESVGTKHSPRVRRGDLPQKARPPEPKRMEGGPDVAGEILARRAAS